MNIDDTIAFAELLDGTCALLTGGKYSPNDASTAIFFRALSAYPIEVVRAAFAEHVRRSRFSPTPADLLDLLAAADGRPGPEEAWSTALSGRDEAETVVWTPEMAKAWTIALPALNGGDEVGARMAFRESYNRLVDEARRHKVPLEWQVMLGHDPARRVEALQRAMAEGKAIEGAVEVLALPPPREAALLLTTDLPQTGDSEAAVKGRAALLALRDRIAAVAIESPSSDVLAKEATMEDRALSAAAVAAYAAVNGIPMPQPGASA